jgi:hypothetical protein
MELDLRKPGDVALVRRAVVNNWPVAQAMRDAICDQLGDAVEAAKDRQVIKLAWLAIMMDARNRRDDGRPAMETGVYLRPTPRPEGNRRPRRGRRRARVHVEIRRST